MATAPEEFCKFFKDQVKFGVDLYKELCHENENAVFCPSSVFAILCMLGVGAKGNTAAQLMKVLKLPAIDSNAEVHESFRNLVITLDAVNPEDVEIIIDSTVFVTEGYPLIEVFVKTLKDKYLASVQYADFQNKREAVKDINTWIAKETKNKITDLVTEDSIEENTRLILTNAVYMKGLWDSKFRPEDTIPDSFHLLNGSVRTVDMMRQESNFRCGHSDELHSGILEMPYKGLEFSMDIILPDNNNAFSALEKSLDAKCIETLLHCLERPTNVILWLPRFRAEVSAALHEILPKLGIVDVFSPEKSDLSGISEEGLFVSAMLQKTFIVVNEEGSEATAATVAVIRTVSARITHEYRVNRPFLYLIRHLKSGAIMFIGRTTSPPESSESSS